LLPDRRKLAPAEVLAYRHLPLGALVAAAPSLDWNLSVQLRKILHIRGIAMFRKHGRTSIRCPMQLKHQQLGFLEVMTRDISASGIFIGIQQHPEMDRLRQLRLGDTLEAEIESADSALERVSLKVARLDKDGFGLMFV
jgi:hypothetical protein